MTPWPNVTWEILPWVSRLPVSRRAQQRMPTSYTSAVVPQIADAGLALPGPLAALVDEATIAAARFDVQDAARLVPFSPLLLRSESVASSRIEQLTSSARRVLEAELLGSTHGNAGLIVANTRQMRAAVSSTTTPTISALLEMHRILLGPSSPDIAGVVRDEPVWIGGSDLHPEGALFVPPAAPAVPDLLRDLEAFLSRTDLPVLVHAALAHAQVETIHPFTDGNGRTGRALIHALLHARGLTRHTALPVSAGLLTNVPAYFQSLDAYRDGDPHPIIEMLAVAALRAAELGGWLAEELSVVRESWEDSVTARRDAADWRALDLLLARPLVTARQVADELDLTPANARKALDRLEGNGILIGSQIDRSTRAWRAPDVLELLDEFAERSGRRDSPTGRPRSPS